MDVIPNNPLLVATEDEIQKIRNSFGIDDEKVLEEKLDAVRKWCEKQAHLAEAFQYINRNVLEHFLLLSKGSVEVTKNKIDKLFTTRGMLPELIANQSYEEFEKLLENFNVVPLPKLDPKNQYRGMVIQVVRAKNDETTLLPLLRFCFMHFPSKDITHLQLDPLHRTSVNLIEDLGYLDIIYTKIINAKLAEFRLFHCYAVSDIFILDLKDVTASALAKINPILLKKAEILCTDAYGYKIKEIYFLNAPSFVDKLLTLIKPFIKEKIMRRVHVIHSFEDLHKGIAKEVLPKDFGGDEPSLAQLSEQWKVYLKTDEAIKLISNSYKVVSDESKRSCFKFNEEYLGLPGSFRQMSVD